MAQHMAETTTNRRQPDDELNCGCGFVWSQFINAGIDSLVNYCPCCGDMKEIKRATKKELIEYLIELHEDFRGYAIIIDGEA